MGEDTGKTSSVLGWLKARLWMAAAAVLLFVSERVYVTMEETTRLLERVGQLEKDDAKWGTLAELKNENVELRVQVEIMRRVWEYEYGRQIPSVTASREEGPRAAETSPTPMPVPLPEVQQEFEPVDPKLFRQEMQQKYPNEQRKK